MRNFLLLLSAILLLANTSASAQEMPPANVVVTQVTQEVIAENQSVIGYLYYERISNISTELAGLVQKVAVNQGDRVMKGDVLVHLDTEILEKEIALKKARIEQVNLRINNAGKNFNRLETLYKQAGVSEKDFDDALYAYQDAQKEKQALEEELGKLLIQKKRSVILAPFDGIVLSKNVDSGAWVQQGSELVRIGSTSDLYVRAPIAENLLQFIENGQEVPVTITAFNKQVSGKIKDIDPVADVKTKNIFLKINIPPLDRVAANMSATVFVPTSEKQTLSIIPRAALIKFQGKDFIYTVKEDKATILPVNIVTFLGDRVGVDNPYMVPGMPVVIEGNERLRPDQPVHINGDS